MKEKHCNLCGTTRGVKLTADPRGGESILCRPCRKGLEEIAKTTPFIGCRICGNTKLTLFIFGACEECAKKAIDAAAVESNECERCGSPRDHYLHEPAEKCHGCLAPHDHHEYRRRGRVA